MADADYPDRARWPEYWRAIRRGGVAFILGILVLAPIAIITDSLEGLAEPWRLIALVVAAFVAFWVGGLLADRIIAAWERRLGHDEPA